MAEPSDATRRFEKRLILFSIAAVLICALGFYTFWSWKSQRNLDAALAVWRAAGQPLDESDFADPPAIPDAQNLAFALRKASAALIAEGNPADKSEYTEALPLSATQVKEAAEYLSKNQAVLSSVRAAHALPTAQWDISAHTWLTMQQINDYRDQRALARVIGLAAHYHTQAGDESAAVHDVLDLLHQADAVGHIEPTLVCHLLAIGIRAMGTGCVEQLAQADVSATTRPATAEQRSALMAVLLDETAAQREWSDAIIGERAIELHNGGPIAEKAFPLPAARQQLLGMLRDTTRLLEIAKIETWPQASALLSALDRPEPRIKTAVVVLDELLRPSLRRGVQTRFRLLAERRLVAVAMAIRWYRMDHAGAFPPTLIALVPKYMDRLPEDSYAADHRTFAYLPKETRPRIYSAGENGTDDGGSMKLLPGEREGVGYAWWNYEDASMFLTQQAPTTQSSNSNN